MRIAQPLTKPTFIRIQTFIIIGHRISIEWPMNVLFDVDFWYLFGSTRIVTVRKKGIQWFY